MSSAIVIQGARENNLKNVTLSIPKHKLVVITGPSGSGKSTLAMDTLQRECQRQFMESMGMVTDSLQKPKVDAITGLSPAISIGQHVTNRNPRSTVGTVTDIYTYLRVLYARLGQRACPHCGTTVTPPLDLFMEQDLTDDSFEHPGMPCPQCRTTLPVMTHSYFSFNTQEGACEGCDGLGHVSSVNTGMVFDEELSLKGGGVKVLFDAWLDYIVSIMAAAGKHYGFKFNPELPLHQYEPAQLALLYYGVESEEFIRFYPDAKPPKTVSSGKYEGILTGLWRRFRENGSGAEYFRQAKCTACNGAKLKKQSRDVYVGGASIAEVAEWPLGQVMDWVIGLKGELPPDGQTLLEPILNDLPTRVKRILDVGLGYLSLNRQSVTLSGGEAQRLRLASILGSGLTGVLYILDEPTAGLHPRDTVGLIRVLQQLRDLENTVLVIEHDTEVMRAADHIIDIGPSAGKLGGYVVGTGTLEQLMQSGTSVTGACMREESLKAGQTFRRRRGNGQSITILDAHARNLKHVTVDFPLGCFITVTGVSGSGKSTLLFDLLAPCSQEGFQPDDCGKITGLEHVGHWITVDQSPIGRMSRSNVATYTDVFTGIRNLFAGLPEAKREKLTSKHFSFNTPGGRCEHCQGLGTVTLDMHFMENLEVRCPVCKGRRFKEEILRIMYKGYTISDLLDMTVQESLELLGDQGKMVETIQLLCEVGLGYLHWGQSVTTLSGGEGQRIRLAKELSKRSKKHTLYLLDEPTTGLHLGDVKQLSLLLNKLVDAGNTVIAVEHNMELVRDCDWVIDIGPEGGEDGGQVVATGTPEQVAAVAASHTGKFLKELLAVR
ncbi:excinuclease ABC subunit UvrA [Paenibacillus koleovorans]|uniref:excinuclease ABC subunit UvrA n=1 Tax=Paenibacillus koleovorans TaxID=121608 RepID=UPI000FDA3502|nr:excinuclease ABC subunit UvrA [Paenibacillus koleovorans]